MLIFALILLGLGFLIAFIGAILQLIAAFRESLAWGLGSLLVPFVSLIFAIAYWAEAKRGFLLQLLGAGLIGGGVFAAAGSAEAEQFKAQVVQSAGQRFAAGKNANAASGTSEQQRAAKEEEIRTVEQQLAALSAKVNADYAALSAQRAKLGKDQTAITAFNQQAAAYQAAKGQLDSTNLRLAALRAEETALSEKVLADARAAAQSGQKPGAAKPGGFSLKGPLEKASGVARQAGAGDVLMFTTQRCPACVAAKDYMKKNGIAYREIDVERDAEGMKEFQRRGGRGVPLIVVKGQQMEGFNPRTLEAML